MANLGTPEELTALIVQEAVKIALAGHPDPVDEWERTLDKMLQFLIVEANTRWLAACVAEAYRQNSEAASLIMERSIVLGRTSHAWNLAE